MQINSANNAGRQNFAANKVTPFNINQNYYSPAKSRRKDITANEYETAKKYLVNKIMNTTIL
jgi:hypothetical protein